MLACSLSCLLACQGYVVACLSGSAVLACLHSCLLVRAMSLLAAVRRAVARRDEGAPCLPLECKGLSSWTQTGCLHAVCLKQQSLNSQELNAIMFRIGDGVEYYSQELNSMRRLFVSLF